ncbi:MAG: NADH-quinone oxidoreductase subunit NuoF [Deltaproteobacteria bacterium]|nr:NADH-quinone oxidoreductase subunit NuoF [Deltaproteobacteria bacterium]
MARIGSPQELAKYREQVLAARRADAPRISVCAGTGCLASGAAEVVGTVKTELVRAGLAGSVGCRGTGCHGFCERGPLIVVEPEEICYVQVKPDDVPEIVARTVQGKEVVERLLYVDPATGERVRCESDIPFYRNQERRVFGANRRIDPRSIEDYVGIGGYRALAKALCEMTPAQVIAEVKESKLRGRGGAGFPTGLKWEATRRAAGQPKYVVVNCDEGDPGAYMDRSLMEGNPFAVLEGLVIGAYAIGAHEGYVYVRQEYPLAVENLAIAIAQAEGHGLLGANVLGSGFDFHVRVHRGAGAFVCGEETALLLSLEGNAGQPRPRPPYPAVSGLWGKPTNINNVETWATVPSIINEGAVAFASIGTEGSKGTKIFSLVGKIVNTGLVEVPMGITLRDIVYKIGGGVPGGKKLKAVQTGGPSGGCIPEAGLDARVDFDELTRAGSMMGSGGMIVMDEDTCMVDVARYFVRFLTDESCGKCAPCREGLRQMHRLLTQITEGRGKEGDLEVLQELADLAQDASLCGLGKTAANPFLSTFRYFREEYEAHIKEKRCPALSCKALTAYWIDPAKCQACLICLRACLEGAIDGGKKRIHVIDQDRCTNCGTCFEVCPSRFGAVMKISGVPVPAPIAEQERAIARGRRQARTLP